MAYSPNRIEKTQLTVDKGSPGASDHRNIGATTIDGVEALNVSIKEGLLSGVTFDFIGVTYPTSTTENFTYRTGGSGGTITAVIELTYTNSSKSDLTSVERLQ